MPIIERVTTEQIVRRSELGMPVSCCPEFQNLWNTNAINGVKLKNMELRFCPFCGDPVVFDEAIIVPEGYEKVSANGGKVKLMEMAPVRVVE